MALSVPIDTRDITVTPVFKHVSVEDVPASERAGHAVMKTIEVVEVRFAGSNLYAPVFPVDAQYRREGHKVITYRERWAEQYRAFLNGDEQKAAGTPLEMLKPYGITDAQLSLCRTLKVYSIEALDHLEGQNLKNLQMNANPLKDMARRYMADRNAGSAAASEIEALKREIEALKATQALSRSAPTPAEIEAAVQVADDELARMAEADLKALIRDRTGQTPRGNPSRETLIGMARDLQAA